MAQAAFMFPGGIRLLRFLSAPIAACAVGLTLAVPASGSDDGTSVGLDNAGSIIGGIAIGGIATLLTVALWRRTRRTHADRDRDRPHGRTAGERRVLQVCNEGREIVNLTTVGRTDTAGSGLSVEQLGVIENKLDLFIAHIRDVTVSAPSEPSTLKLNLAAKHAGALYDAVRTERTIRLTSISTDPLLLDATRLQLATERTSLDRALREIAAVITRSS